MSAPATIDIDALLAPVSEESAAGSDPRSDTSPNSLYYRAKDARNAGRSAERASTELGGPPPPEWDTVVDTSQDILIQLSKDLEVASWLVEGLLRVEGFAGLRDGLKVLTGFASRYWETCFPELDDDGVEGKVTSVAGLNGAGAVGTLIQPIRLTSITRGSSASFSYWNYEQALDLEKITDTNKRQDRIKNGAVPMDLFMQSVSETPALEFRAIVEMIDECLAALSDMDKAFDAVAGGDAPPVSALRDMLQQVNGAIRHFAADKLAMAEIVAPAEESTAELTVSEDGGTTVTVVRKIDGYASRDEALAELMKIASYFRKTEPHSPISYTIEDAVRRSRMTLPDLLIELAEDPALVKRILLAAGIKDGEAAA